MNIHYTVYKEYELNTSESAFKHGIRALIQSPSENEWIHTDKEYVGEFKNNEFWLERRMQPPFYSNFTEILGRYVYSDNKLTIHTWTRIRPFINWLFIMGLPLQFLWMSLTVLQWENDHYFIGVIAIAEAFMYFLLIRLVREDARHFEKVVATITAEQTTADNN